MPSLKLVRLPLTSAQIADGAITTSKLADGAVTPAKVGSGVMSNAVPPIDHTATSYTLDAGAEQVLATVSGNGAASILFSGDGDGVFRVRVYIDGSMEEEFPTNETRVGAYSFTSSLEVKLHNPGTASATQTSTSFSLRGVAR